MKKTSTSTRATLVAVGAALLIITLGAPPRAVAADWSVRATLEPGMGSLTPPEAKDSDWGAIVGLSLALRAGDLFWIAVAGAWDELPADAAYKRVQSLAAFVHYPLDLSEIEPFFELGAAWVNTTDRRLGAASEIVPVLGLGVDFSLLPWLQVGAAVRYEPILESDLFSAAYMGWHSRVTVCTQGL